MKWVILLGEYWIPVVLVVIAIAAFLVYLTIKAHQKKVSTGEEGIVGKTGVYKGEGLAMIHGELWKIRNPDAFAIGDKLKVLSVERLFLDVTKI